MLYVGQVNGCQKMNDIYAKHGSKEDIVKLNVVPKALKSSPMKALRDFQRRQFEMPLNSSVPITTRFSIILGRIIAQLLN